MIVVENLGRYFGEVKAVDGISFQVNKGDVLGFLGPNGAGKSTTMKMLTSFLTPSFGKASIGGFDVVEQSRESRKLFGYLPENAPLYGEMTPREFLHFVAEVRGVGKEAIDRVIGLTNIGAVINRKIETLSKGFRRRVGLAQALLHDPEVLILDEPTDGLDPNQKHEVRLLINQMAEHKAIILSTHILEEVDAVCSRVIIIAQGKIVVDSNPGELGSRGKLDEVFRELTTQSASL
jgi:ABC-2 type transport system ATP-binding protein